MPAISRQHSSLAQRNDQAGLRLQALRPQLRLERGGHRLALLRARLDAALLSNLNTRVQALQVSSPVRGSMISAPIRDKVLGSRRIRDGDEDPCRQRGPPVHGLTPSSASQRSTR